MCNISYSIYLRELEPYIEKYEEPSHKYTGIIFDTIDEIFKVPTLLFGLIQIKIFENKL